MIENQNQTQADKLKQALANKSVQGDNRQTFNNLNLVYLGVEVKEHYPYKRDKDGKKIPLQGSRGYEREEKFDGYLTTFSQAGTSDKVLVVLSKRYNLNLLEVYRVSGRGYYMNNASMYFIDKDTKIAVL